MTDLYVDTSALIKRVFVEDQSAHVREVLHERSSRGDFIVSSELAWVEVARALLRTGIADAEGVLDDACSGVARYPLSSVVLDLARRIRPSTLRALDAIHLASIVSLRVTELFTFDQRLAHVATSLGVTAIP